MEATFRASMNWLHSWAGVMLGGLLFAIFWTGTLSVFDREIDRWMMPDARLSLPSVPPSLDALRALYEAAARARSPTWLVGLPTERDPVLRVSWNDCSGPVTRRIDPATGASLPDPGTKAATGFLYPFHYMLHLRAWDLGWWIVALAAMAMLALCVSGTIIHRRIFTDFFTLRGQARPRRFLLDLHNTAGALALPFHAAITLSGLIVLWSFYFPGTVEIAYRGGRQAFARDLGDRFDRPRLNRPGDLASIDGLVAAARRLWDGAMPRFLLVRHPGDLAAYVQIARSREDRLGQSTPVAYFDAASGALLSERGLPRPVQSAQGIISGLHLIQFRHWTLRWLYFGSGLAGCVLIATGSIFWLESRRKRQARVARRTRRRRPDDRVG